VRPMGEPYLRQVAFYERRVAMKTSKAVFSETCDATCGSALGGDGTLDGTLIVSSASAFPPRAAE
jgi:hypothetical protein